MRRRIITKIEDVEKIAKEIGKIKNVKAVYLFGSHATGKALPMSDIDVCVITTDINEKIDREIIGFCSDNLDVSVFHLLPISIKIRVFRDSKPLLIKDSEFVNRLKLKTLAEYLDFKPAINRFCMETLGCTI